MLGGIFARRRWHDGAARPIAGQLVVTLDTVKKHGSQILSKLGAANRAGYDKYVRRLGCTGAVRSDSLRFAPRVSGRHAVNLRFN